MNMTTDLKEGRRQMRQGMGFFVTLCLTLSLFPCICLGQWTTQTIVLRPGWNAVYLEVQPEPRDCDSIFSSLPVESVWGWNRRFTTVQFIQDANQLLPGRPDWLTYFPGAIGDPSLNTLFALHGDRCYLVKSTASQPVTWTLKGRPVPPVKDWIAGSMNLVGFPMDGTSPPSFASFFAGSAAHAGQAIYRLQPSGLWTQVANPVTERMSASEAFWVFTSSASSYGGPIGVKLEQSQKIDFGRTVPETWISLKNVSKQPRNFQLIPNASQTPPDANSPALAGGVPLSYWQFNLASKQYGWYPLEPQTTITVAPGQETKVRLAVRRKDLTPFLPPAGNVGAEYQSLLTVIDQVGDRVTVPVTARAAVSGGKPALAAFGGVGTLGTSSDAAPDVHAGLWVGTAVIQKVSQTAGSSDPTVPRPTGSQAQFRLIVHVNSSGQARLLQQVMLMWTNGVVDSFGNIQQLGRQVLITDDSLVSQFSGAALRDGKPVARRISTIGFGFSGLLPLVGPFGDLQNPLTGTVVTGYDDPLNPFKHRFHPDHDNLDAEHSVVLPEGVESYTIRRLLQLNFSGEDPEGRARAQWGDSELGGTYTETITGIHKIPIVIQGIFRLNRVSLIPFLNTEG